MITFPFHFPRRRWGDRASEWKMRLGRTNKGEKWEGLAKESHPFPLLLIFSHLLAVSFSHVLLQIMNADYAGQQAIVHPPPQRHYYAQRKGDGLSERLTSQVEVFHRVMLHVTVAGCLTC